MRMTYMQREERSYQIARDRAEATKARLEADAVHAEHDRPQIRGECGVDRPCPWVSCRHHLYLDVKPSGAIKINYPDKEPWELEHTCSLDIADRGGMTLEEVGDAMNVTRERTRQIESSAKRQLGEHAKVLR